MIGVVAVSASLACPDMVLGLFDDDDVPHRPQTELNVTLNETEEVGTLSLEVGDAFETGLLREVYVVVYPAGSDDGVRAVVESGPERNQEGVWVADDGSGVASFPVELGDEVRVVSDGVDSDGDGRAGIERGDIVQIIYVTDEGAVEYGNQWEIGASATSGNATEG
jgi:hypothetical protein